MGRGGKQDQRIRATGQETGQARTAGKRVFAGAGGDGMTLVDDDDIPPGVL